MSPEFLQNSQNSNGLRTRKILADGTTTVYHYDSNGHLIAETSETGQPVRDYIWADDRPVARIETSRDTQGALHNDNIIYLFTDHLNTPRIGTNPTGTLVWRNDAPAFGEQAANDDPDGDGNATEINLRFPGQYFDAESGLHYNWHRYYNPETGRYLSSDPIGLEGGINTFGYVGHDPLGGVDPRGLAGRGNRGDGSASGRNTNSPYKHCREVPGKPGKLKCKRKRDGKWVEVPKPKDWGGSQKTMCGDECKRSVIWVVGIGVVSVCCALRPDLCALGTLLLSTQGN